jgi:amidase
VHGPIVRTVADAALWLDATHGLAQGDAGSPAPAPSEPFAAAAARPPGKLRIAVSTKLLPGIVAPLAREPREAVEETAELLRSLGHDVVERDPDYDPRSMGNAVIRIMRGVDDDARNFRPRSRLERRTRGWARLGRTLPDSLVARARADEAAIAARVLRLFDDHDVLLTPAASKPPMRVGAYDGRGWLWTMVADTAFICYTVIANITGQPAATLPAGLDANGLPRGVQLIARPNDEATLLSLSAQIEAERPWVDQRPPVS